VTTKKTNTVPVWKSAEKIAAILEKQLAPAATVKHNVFLPVIGKPNRKPRQCDVVITYGQEPRQSIAIVEVQKRRKKPDINTFHGWLRKMSEVGAQQLICVSALGYPESVIDDVATRIGPTVKLMTLEELESAGEPGRISMMPFMIVNNPKYEFEEIGPVKFNGSINVDTVEFNSENRIFSIGDNTDCINLIELTTNALANSLPLHFSNQGIMEPDSYSVELAFAMENKLWLHHQGQKVRISKWSIRVRVNIERKVVNIPMSQFAYRQEFRDGTLAWIATTRIPMNGKEREVQLVFKPDESGFLQIAPIL
jgi:hypothetical protein